jgi:methionine-S-sulfoxide reductase
MKKILIAAILIMGFMTADLSAKSNIVQNSEKAIFAGGCFWCMQPVFDSAEGVISTRVGYTGGHTKNPTYDELNTHNTGHYEAIEVVFDPKKADYEELVRIYFANIDPFDAEGQFADKGQQYHTVIFYGSEMQKKTAEKVKAEVAAKFPDKKIAVQLLPAAEFYTAEDYHQEYYKKNPTRYEMYKYGSGRATGIKKIWAK